MTNEEKALEIADNAKKQIYFDKRCNDLVGNKTYEAAMIMTEWKNRQFEDFLRTLQKCHDTNTLCFCNLKEAKTL